MIESDFVVIGAGIAGSSVAFELASRGRTFLLEQEDHAGYHATGRSAAMLMRAYGHGVTRSLTKASIPFLQSPPEGFSDAELLRTRGGLWLRNHEDDRVARSRESHDSECGLVELDHKQVMELVPVLRREFAIGALFEPDACEIDVHALLSGYLKSFRKRDGQLVKRQEVRRLTRSSGKWTVETDAERYRAAVVVNAAGAWGDTVADRAGIKPLGLTAKRRTAFTFALPGELNAQEWPFTVATRESFYFTPDAGLLLASPADETPVPPGDTQADDLDVALGAQRIENATTLVIGSIRKKWAGLRTFTPDGYPAVGPDPAHDGFIWLVGQGGAGMMTAPALARFAAAIAAGEKSPVDIESNGIGMECLSPARFGQARQPGATVGA